MNAAQRCAVLIAALLPGWLATAGGQTVPQRPEGASAQAQHFQGHWYEWHTLKGNLSWQEAQEDATSRGGHLVAIETPEEREFVNQLIAGRRPVRFWAGGFWDNELKSWRWITGPTFLPDFKVGQRERRGTRMLIGDANEGRRFLAIQRQTEYFGWIIEFSPGEQVALHMPADTDPSPDPSAPSIFLATPGEPIIGNPHAPPLELKAQQVRVNGLLIMELASGGHAGQASPLTLTALHADPTKPASLQFNQPVGPTMHKALEEVVKFTELRHRGWPRGQRMEISFEDKYSPKDGPSAAVACAVLLESTITGRAIDPRFAVTGDMNADGSVQAIGGVEAKVRGATNRDCTHIAIPEKNVAAVFDTVLMDGIAPVVDIQVFSIASFGDADALAFAQKSGPAQVAIDAFGEIQAIYQRDANGFSQTVRHPAVIEKLRAVLNAAPNHVSAALLLAFAEGRGPQTLSLHGSFTFIDDNAFQIVDVIKDGQVAKVEHFDEDQVADAVSLLRRSKQKLDERTWEWADRLVQWGELMRQYQTNRPSSVANVNKLIDEINAAADRVRAERERLLKDPEIMEELLE